MNEEVNLEIKFQISFIPGSGSFSSSLALQGCPVELTSGLRVKKDLRLVTLGSPVIRDDIDFVVREMILCDYNDSKGTVSIYLNVFLGGRP